MIQFDLRFTKGNVTVSPDTWSKLQFLQKRHVQRLLHENDPATDKWANEHLITPVIQKLKDLRTEHAAQRSSLWQKPDTPGPREPGGIVPQLDNLDSQIARDYVLQALKAIPKQLEASPAYVTDHELLCRRPTGEEIRSACDKIRAQSVHVWTIRAEPTESHGKVQTQGPIADQANSKEAGQIGEERPTHQSVEARTGSPTNLPTIVRHLCASLAALPEECWDSVHQMSLALPAVISSVVCTRADDGKVLSSTAAYTLLRPALSGTGSGPHMADIIVLLGRDEVVSRLEAITKVLEEMGEAPCH